MTEQQRLGQALLELGGAPPGTDERRVLIRQACEQRLTPLAHDSWWVITVAATLPVLTTLLTGLYMLATHQIVGRRTPPLPTDWLWLLLPSPYEGFAVYLLLMGVVASVSLRLRRWPLPSLVPFAAVLQVALSSFVVCDTLGLVQAMEGRVAFAVLSAALTMILLVRHDRVRHRLSALTERLLELALRLARVEQQAAPLPRPEPLD